MKILMISNDFLPNPGGVANHIFELAKALVLLGNEVWVLHLCYSKITPQLEELAGVKIVRCYVAENLAEHNDISSKLKRYLATTYYGRKYIQQVITQFNPVVLHWHDYYHTSLAMHFVKFIGLKILTNHASGYLEHYAKGFFYHCYLKFIARRADAIIAPSEELANKSKILNKPVYYIPNGVDVDKFIPLNASMKAHIKGKYTTAGTYLIVAPRRLDPKNGLHYLIQALPLITAKISNILLLIAGGGSVELKNAYLQLARTLNVENIVKITGNIPYIEMPNVIGSADVIVIPSIMEAVSLAALEALACGVPVVATNVGGLPLIVDNAVGELVAAANPQALAAGIIKILSLPQQQYHAKRIAARNKVVSGYTWRHAAIKTLSVYEGL